MTVEQLIKKLKTLPKDMPVMTNATEDGYHSDLTFTDREVEEFDNMGEWYYGDYDDVRPGTNGTKIIVIS